MKILIGSDGNTLESKVSMRFGHSNFFLIYDSLTKDLTPIENNEKGHTHLKLEEIMQQAIDAVIVGNIGPHAFEIIKSLGARMFLARKMTVEEAIEKLLKDELEELLKPTAKKSIHKH